MISVDEDRCTGCGVCVGVCPTDAISVVDGAARIRHALCRECEACIPACPTGALSAEGESVETEGVGPRRMGMGRSMRTGRGRGLGRGTEMGRPMRRGLRMGRHAAARPTTRAASASPAGSVEGEVAELKDMLGGLREELAEVLDRLDQLRTASRARRASPRALALRVSGNVGGGTADLRSSWMRQSSGIRGAQPSNRNLSEAE